MNTPIVLSLSDPAAVLEMVGGKGQSLTKLIRAGFPVPNGFHVTTQAYRQFVTLNNLKPGIQAALAKADALLPATLEAASAEIGMAFAAAPIPPDVESAICEAYHALRVPDSPVHVAVRSSATAEDLPGASFAGQQETYLNILGTANLLEAVKKCWASLWTGRAISYRIKNGISHQEVALAVVVQEMVNAETSGILFTANPMNGRRDEMVINAAWGLGEAIVGGLVTPDCIIIDKTSGKIKQMEVAEKTVMSIATATGTQVQPLMGIQRKLQVMKEEQVAEIIKLANQIEGCYGCPQDIEWCFSNNRFAIVQSRPITALTEPEVPLPADWKMPKGNYAAMRNNIVELMADPLSPLFATMGLSAINASLHRIMNESFAMSGIMPEQIIIAVNHYAYNNGSVSAKSMIRLLFGTRKILKNMFTGAVERWTETGRPRYFKTVETWRAKNWRGFSSVELLDSARLLTEAAIDAYGALISGVIPAAWITEALFTKVYDLLIKRRGDPSAPVYLLGFNSLPIRADMELYRLAEWAGAAPTLTDCLLHTSNPTLIKALQDGETLSAGVPDEIWQEFRQRFNEYLGNYGHALYDLDFAHPLPVDDPAPVLNTFRLYLERQGVNPMIRQKESETRREQASQILRNRLKGWQLSLFNRLVTSAQKYAPLREDGLAEIGLAYPLIRQMLTEIGRRFANRQMISTETDLFWLTEDEIRKTAARLDAGQPVEPLTEKVLVHKAELRAAAKVEPPVALPQMKIFGFDLMSLKKKRGRGEKGNSITGVAASPGKVTGTARVLHGPIDFEKMAPGNVLVAPITTPAWTPLFAQAAAVVTDIGGPLSHGSIVAREYGIPAVLGTGVATRAIQDGQTITVDGSAGKVILHNL